MTFTTRIKEEISKQVPNKVEEIAILSSFLNYNSVINDNITIISENASVLRFIYKIIKATFDVTPSVKVRIQKRFKVKQIYILEVNDKVQNIKDILNINIDTDEERIAYLKGAFLGTGNVSNPQTSGYHLEFIFDKEKDAIYITSLLNHFNLNAKVIKRGYKYVSYIKASECISDLIKMFKTINTLFEFEDVRIYRDHKNMVNRLNNCEIANEEKSIKTGMKQIEDIKFLEDNDLIDLLDEKTKLVIEYRKKYPEISFKELANIITMETDYHVGKSGINHHFIKIKNIKENYNKR